MIVLCGFPSDEQFFLLLLIIPIVAYLSYRYGKNKGNGDNYEERRLREEIKITRQKVELQKLKKELGEE